MRKISFIKEPGYVYDLFSLFRFWFNSKENTIQLIDEQNAGEFGNNGTLLNDYIPIADELLIFFYEKDNNKTFMTEYFFEPYICDFPSERYDLSKVLKLLAEYNQVICNVYKFYFAKEAKTEGGAFAENLADISNMIRKSSYNGEVKSVLYAFFIEPISFIQKLTYELMAKELVMAQKYKQAHSELVNLQKTFDYEELAEGLSKIDKQKIDIKCLDNVYVTFCLNNKNLLFWCCVDNSNCLMLGVDYRNSIQRLVDSNADVRLDLFGNAISEINRVNILNYILKIGETNIKDIEQELGFTSANAYYHLALMLKIGLLKSRNQGRTVLYSVNNDYFDSLNDVLRKYSNKKENNV